MSTAFYHQFKLIGRFAALALFAATFSASAIDQNPYSLRSPWYIENDGTPYWEVRVTCSDKKTRNFIIQYDKAEPWCAKDLSGFCHAEKIGAAFQVCSGDFSVGLAEKERRDLEKQGELAEKEILRTRLLARRDTLRQQREKINGQRQQLQRKEQELRARQRDIIQRRAELR